MVSMRVVKTVILRCGAAVEGEIHIGAFAASDPVALHGADLLRPAFHAVEALQQFLCIVGDAERPLLEFALLDRRVFVTPAAAVHDLLIGEHGGTVRAPVHLALLSVGQALLKQLEEEPLVPAVILGQAGCDLARPVIAEAEALHLCLHGGNVVERPLAWLAHDS